MPEAQQSEWRQTVGVLAAEGERLFRRMDRASEFWGWQASPDSTAMRDHTNRTAYASDAWPGPIDELHSLARLSLIAARDHLITYFTLVASDGHVPVWATSRLPGHA